MFQSHLTYGLLLSFGVHVGHSLWNSHVYSAGLIFVYTLKIAYINLYKSVLLARIGFLALSAACMNYSPIWFINLDYVNKHYAKNAADSCGEYSGIGKGVHGALSNYETVAPLILKLLRMSHKGHNTRQRGHQGGMQYWITSRHSYPRAVFTPSVCESYSPVSEAFFLNIPCFGVVDTNAYTNTVSIAFPGNDDSLDCLSLYNELAVNYILIKKFKIVMFWFTFIREYKAIINFKNRVKSLGTDGLDTKIENGIKDRLRLGQHYFSHWIKIPEFTFNIQSFGSTLLYPKKDLDMMEFPGIDTISPETIFFEKFDKKFFLEESINSLDILKDFYFNNSEIFNKILYSSINYGSNSAKANPIYHRMQFFYNNFFYKRNYGANHFLKGRARRGKMRGNLDARSARKYNYKGVDRDIASHLAVSTDRMFIIYKVVLECTYNNNLSNLTMANLGGLTYNYNIFKFFGLTNLREIDDKDIIPFTFNKVMNTFARGIKTIFHGAKPKKLGEKFLTHDSFNLFNPYRGYNKYIGFEYDQKLYFIEVDDLAKLRCGNKGDIIQLRIEDITEKYDLYCNSSLVFFYSFDDVVDIEFILFELEPPGPPIAIFHYRINFNTTIQQEIWCANQLFHRRIVSPRLFKRVQPFARAKSMNLRKKYLKSLLFNTRFNYNNIKYFGSKRMNNSIPLRRKKRYSYDNFFRFVIYALPILFRGRIGGLQYSNDKKYGKDALSSNSLKFFLKNHFLFDREEQQKRGYTPSRNWNPIFTNPRKYGGLTSKKIFIKKYFFDAYDTLNPVIIALRSKGEILREKMLKFLNSNNLIQYIIRKPFALKKRKGKGRMYRFYRFNKYERNNLCRNLYHKKVLNRFANGLINKRLLIKKLFSKSYVGMLKFLYRTNIFFTITSLIHYLNLMTIKILRNSLRYFHLLLPVKRYGINNKFLFKIFKYLVKTYDSIKVKVDSILNIDLAFGRDDLSMHYILLNRASKQYVNECKRHNRIEGWNIENVERWRRKQLRKQKRMKGFSKKQPC